MSSPQDICIVTLHDAADGGVLYVDSASGLDGVETVCQRLRQRFQQAVLIRVAQWTFDHHSRPVLKGRLAFEFKP